MGIKRETVRRWLPRSEQKSGKGEENAHAFQRPLSSARRDPHAVWLELPHTFCVAVRTFGQAAECSSAPGSYRRNQRGEPVMPRAQPVGEAVAGSVMCNERATTLRQPVPGAQMLLKSKAPIH